VVVARKMIMRNIIVARAVVKSVVVARKMKIVKCGVVRGRTIVRYDVVMQKEMIMSGVVIEMMIVRSAVVMSRGSAITTSPGIVEEAPLVGPGRVVVRGVQGGKDEEEYLRSQKRGKEEDSRREHQHQSRSRASRTVLIAQLGMDVTDRTVYLIMSKMAGKVRDVQIIRDGRSQRSKGIAYVEFEEQESAMKALGIEPTSLWTKLGHGANIQPSQAEKNLNSTQAVINPSGERVNECRLYVGGSANLVADLSEDDLRALFQPFGPLDFVDRHPRNQGEGGTYAFVQYGDPDHARSALKGLSGMMIGGKELKVGMATSAATAGVTSSAVVGPNTDLDLVEDNDEGPSTHTGLLKDNLSRARLMRAMVREPITEGSSLLMKSATRLPASNLASAASGAATGTGSRVLILRNLWAAGDQLMHEGGPEKFFKEITDDVKSEANRFGTIVGCWLDEASENGDCWLKFTTGSAAAKCALGLNRRWFAGRQLVAVVVSEDKWDTGL
ncbi:hypothetical protein FOZ62_027937, partial [Perkinsus olseni]